MSDFRQELKVPTLCFPDGEKSCFSCCPPIRPAGYEHIQHGNIIKRVLRENSEAFKRHAEGKIPITGFSCWALGYLDKNHRLIGCLLHPAQNAGVDLRYRTDYGEKCEREFCLEAKVFSGLSWDEKEFWLHLADGLDSFSYSSRKLNPLFKMMDWGGRLLSLTASNENHRTFTKESFFQSYPFFSTNYPPKPNVYMMKWLVNREGIRILKSNSFKSKFEVFSERISKALCKTAQKNNPPPPLFSRGRRSGDFPPFDKVGRSGDFEVSHTHRLDLDRNFLDLLRLSAGITKTTKQDALALKDLVDKALEQFRQTLGRI